MTDDHLAYLRVAGGQAPGKSLWESVKPYALVRWQSYQS